MLVVIFISIVIKVKEKESITLRTSNIPTAWQGPEAGGLGPASEAPCVCSHVFPNTLEGPGKAPSSMCIWQCVQ